MKNMREDLRGMTRLDSRCGRNMMVFYFTMIACVGISMVSAAEVVEARKVWGNVGPITHGNPLPYTFLTGQTTVQRLGQRQIWLSTNETACTGLGVDDEIFMRVNGGDWVTVAEIFQESVSNITEYLQEGANTLEFVAQDNEAYLYYCSALYVVMTGEGKSTQEVRPGDGLADKGDPVNIINGNSWREETDVHVPSPGIPLTLQRFSNSRGPLSNSFGVMGVNWRHSYEWTVRDFDGLPLNTNQLSNDRLVETPSGDQYRFTNSMNGRLIAVGDCPFDLRSCGSNEYEILPQSSFSWRKRSLTAPTCGVSIVVGPPSCVSTAGVGNIPMQWRLVRTTATTLGTGWTNNGDFMTVYPRDYTPWFQCKNSTGPWWAPYPENLIAETGTWHHQGYVMGTVQTSTPKIVYGYGLAVDNLGRVYVSDYDSYANKNYLRRFDYRTNTWELLSGTNVFAGGLLAGMTVDDSYNVYIADYQGDTVRKRAANGTWSVISLGGRTNTSPGYMYLPRDVEIGIDGNIYVCDQNNTRVQKWNPTTSNWSIFADCPSDKQYVYSVTKSGNYLLVLANQGVNDCAVYVYDMDGNLVDTYECNTYDFTSEPVCITAYAGRLYMGCYDNKIVECDWGISNWNWRTLCSGFSVSNSLLPQGISGGYGYTMYPRPKDIVCTSNGIDFVDDRSFTTNGIVKRLIRPTWEQQSDWRMRFGGDGLLKSIQDVDGNKVDLVYTNVTGMSVVLRCSHSSGQTLTFSYDPVRTGLLSKVETDSTNLWTTYSYDDTYRLTSVVHVVNGTPVWKTYEYANPTNGCVSKYRNARDDVYLYDYCNGVNGTETNAGKSMQIEGSGYYQHDVTYYTNATVMTYSRGDTNQVYTYRFADPGPVLTSVEGPTGTSKVVTFNRDIWANAVTTKVSEATVGQTSIIVNVENAVGYLLRSGVGLNATPSNTWLYTWNICSDLLERVQGEFSPYPAVGYEYDGRRMTKAKVLYKDNATNEYVTRFGYTTNGLLSSVTNANGHWVRFGYDNNGYLSSVQPQVGPSVSLTNNLLGQTEQIVMPGPSGWRVTRIEPDGKGRTRRVVYPDNSEETMVYDGVGNLTNHVDIGRRTTHFEYESGMNLSKVVRDLPEGGSITNSVTYNKQFNTVRIKDALDRAVETYTLDLQNRPVAVTNIEGQTMTLQYGVGDYVKFITRFDGTIVSNQYNTDSLLAKTLCPGNTNTYTYFRSGLVNSVTNRSGKITILYDRAMRMTNIVDCAPSGRVSYVYFPAGQVSNVVSSSGTYVYKHDEAERMTNLAWGTRNFRWTYDTNNGMCTTVAMGTNVAVAYSYDCMDRSTSVVWRVNGAVTRQFLREFNASGMVSRVTRENGAGTVYEYDGLDRLLRETVCDSGGNVDSVNSFTYDAVGNRLTKNSAGTNVVYVYPYGNSGNRLTQWYVTGAPACRVDVSGSSSETIATNDFASLNYVSNSTVVVAPSVLSTSFWASSFPVAMGSQRIVAAISDMAGNIGYATTTVRAVVVTNASYLYSAGGYLTNLTYVGFQYTNKVVLSWDGQYQLTSIQTNGVVAEKYEYDGFGRRLYICIGTLTNWFVYDGEHVIEEYQRSASKWKVQCTYAYGPGIDNILAMTVYTGSTVKTYYYLTDVQNTVYALVDQNGQIVEQYQYDAWGRVLSVKNGSGVELAKSALGNRYLWQGREYSWATGLYYFRARWYDPVVGRWLSNDPIGISGGLNQYVAFENSPVNFVDYTGSAPEPVSLPHYNRVGVMVHSEVPSAGAGTGNVHIQAGNTKYFFHADTGRFLGAGGEAMPGSLAKQIDANKRLRQAIGKAVRRVNVQGGGFAPKYGNGLGRFIPVVAIGAMIYSTSAYADDICQESQEYYRALRAGDQPSADLSAAALASILEQIVPLSSYGVIRAHLLAEP